MSLLSTQTFFVGGVCSVLGIGIGWAAHTALTVGGTTSPQISTELRPKTAEPAKQKPAPSMQFKGARDIQRELQECQIERAYYKHHLEGTPATWTGDGLGSLEPASMDSAVRKALEMCGRDPSDMVLDCEEPPCIVAIWGGAARPTLGECLSGVERGSAREQTRTIRCEDGTSKAVELFAVLPPLPAEDADPRSLRLGSRMGAVVSAIECGGWSKDDPI